MKYLIVMLFILNTGNLLSQNIELGFYSTGAGRNLTASFSKKFDKTELGVGLGFNINSIKQPDDQDKIYHKRLYATKAVHYLNFNAYYDYYFYNKWNCIKPLIFYDFQLKYSTTRTSMYIPHDYDSTIVSDDPADKILYVNRVEYFGPFLWIENSIGLGYKVDITDKIYLKQKLGLGIQLIFGDEKRLVRKNPTLEYFGLVNIGVGIKINSS